MHLSPNCGDYIDIRSEKDFAEFEDRMAEVKEK